MGSYRFDGFRSRAGNSGTEKGLVLQSETSSKSNVAIHPAVQHNFRHPVCDISICSRAQGITLFSTPETGGGDFLHLTKLVSDHKIPIHQQSGVSEPGPSPILPSIASKESRADVPTSLLFCSADLKNRTWSFLFHYLPHP
jgi:hypothetical protein